VKKALAERCGGWAGASRAAGRRLARRGVTGASSIIVAAAVVTAFSLAWALDIATSGRIVSGIALAYITGVNKAGADATDNAPPAFRPYHADTCHYWVYMNVSYWLEADACNILAEDVERRKIRRFVRCRFNRGCARRRQGKGTRFLRLASNFCLRRGLFDPCLPFRTRTAC